MEVIKNKKKMRFLCAIICALMVCGVFSVSVTPVAAADIFSKKVTKAAGTWNGSARHASTFIKVTYGCKKSLLSYKDHCQDSVSAAIGQKHRARIKNSEGLAYGKKVEYGIVSSITKKHVGKVTYFQSKYHMK